MPSVGFDAKRVARRFAILSLAVAASGGVIGCGSAQDAADAPAQDDMAQAQAAIDQGNWSQAQTSADAAAAITGVSPGMAYRVHMLRGQISLANANAMLNKAQESEMNVSRLLGSIQVGTMQAALASSEVKSNQSNDPAASITDLQSRAADAQGASGAADWPPPKLPAYTPPVIDIPAAPAAEASAVTQPAKTGGIGGFLSAFLGAKPATTVPTPGAGAPATEAAAPATEAAPIVIPPSKPLDIQPVRTLAGLDADISRLKSAVQANTSQAQSLQAQRLALMSQADDLQKKSLNDKDQESVDDVAAAADAGRKAADLQVEMDKLTSARMDLKVDLDKATAQRAGVVAAVDGFSRQIADLQLTWKSVQQNIEDEKRAIAALAGPAGTPAAAPAAGDSNMPAAPVAALTIADQCTQLKAAVADTRDFREKAADQLKNALREFNSAGKAGDEYRSEASTALSDRTPPAERTALLQLQEVFAGPTAWLLAADTERTLAINYASDAMVARQVKQTLTAAQAALGEGAPSAVADCLAATTASGTTMEDYGPLAEERFKDALDHFDNLSNQAGSGIGANSRRASAMAGKMITAYGAKQLSLAMSSKPVAGQTPDELQKAIDSSAKDLFDLDPTMLPGIPYTIPAAPAAGA